MGLVRCGECGDCDKQKLFRQLTQQKRIINSERVEKIMKTIKSFQFDFEYIYKNFNFDRGTPLHGEAPGSLDMKRKKGSPGADT